MANFTVKSEDTSVYLRSAMEALKEVEKLAVYEIIASVLGDDGTQFSIDDLRAAARAEARDDFSAVA